jgi:hypothetical protein
MSSKHTSKNLAEIFDTLDDERKKSLFDYAEFLQSKGGLVEKEIGEPVDIPRPDEETVVGAVKRLKQTYPMIESMTVFSAASSLMTEHMVNGRDVIEVIDEMEKLFEESFNKLLKDME